MALRSFVRKLRLPASLQRLAGSRPVDSLPQVAPPRPVDSLQQVAGPRAVDSLQQVAGSRAVASQDKMCSSAVAKTTDPTAAQIASFDEQLRSCFEKEARRQRRSMWKAVLGAEAAALLIAFGGLCYVHS